MFTRSILQLCGVSKDDEALYTCVASNDVNISQSSFFLNVIGELVGILCVISSLGFSHIYIPAVNSAPTWIGYCIITCKTPKMRKNTYIVSRQLTIHTCVSSEPPTIAIKPSDTNAPYNSTVLLTCVVGEEDRITNIFWQKDSESISDSSGSVQVFGDVVMEGGVNFTRSILQLCSVTFEEEGTYSCVANNSAGTTSANFSVSVFTEGKFVLLVCVCVHVFVCVCERV